MINTTRDSIVFNCSGAALDAAIRAALTKSAETLLSVHQLEQVELSAVTTKTNLRACYPMFVKGCVLKATTPFDEAYVRTAHEAQRNIHDQVPQAQFEAVMLPSNVGNATYKKAFAGSIKVGLGLFLLALHCSGAITLPTQFRWPSAKSADTDINWRRREIGGLVCSELLSFVRQLNSQDDTLPHPAFASVGGHRKRREWFLTYGTRLLLATGWQRAEDVNIKDLLAIKGAEAESSALEMSVTAIRALLDVLRLAYGDRVRVTVEDWAEAMRSPGTMSTKARPYADPSMKSLEKGGPRADRDLVKELLSVQAAWGLPKAISTLSKQPGLDVDMQPLTVTWIDLENLFIEKTKRETYKTIYKALSWWNLYLFYYLPYWFARNQGTSLVFPRSPSLLDSSVYVSRLLQVKEERPITFIEFMNEQSSHREWENNTLYGTLLQLSKFFDFIERYSEEIPGCEGFKQPIAEHDYPRTSRLKATRKHPVPRRFFAVYLDYHEALLAHHQIVTQRVLSGELSAEELRTITANINVIDTLATADHVGFVPLLFTKSKTIRLQFIPNLLDPGWRTTVGGRPLYLPHPHGLHQNLVALHTGVRHNHIQWLDHDSFDRLVDDGDVDFTLLLVNTDKQKDQPWAPYVAMRVVELLRAQRAWSDLIAEPGFHARHFYNNNPETKWPKFRPLFAYTKDGRPHKDGTYTDAWQAMLCGLQGLLPELEEYGPRRRLLRLLPPGHRPEDANLDEKLEAYGAKLDTDAGVCPLNVMSRITPHSARVSVVSQYVTFLPTDLIGKKITGQKPGVVSYYVSLDQEALEAEQVHQAARMRDAALRNAMEPVTSGKRTAGPFVHADNVNSNLARALRANVNEAIVRFGCMSISFNEDATKGIDVLLETQGVDAVANKTEICPYGNKCPPHIVKALRGFRRCGLCNFAVRSIDHLPPIAAKIRQVAETVDELETVLAADAKTLASKYTAEEIDLLEDERAQLCEEMSGWLLNQERLEHARQRLESGEDTRMWVVPKPEILERALRRVEIPSTMTQYVLARLGECIAYPTLESPQIRARFDLLRRELLARAGSLKAAFSSPTPIDPAAEAAGALKSLMESAGISVHEVSEMLETGSHLTGLTAAPPRLLAES